MLPVSDGSVIAATTPIIVRDNNISAMVKAYFLTDSPLTKLRTDSVGVIASDQRERGNPLENAALVDWIATRSATARNDGISFNVIPNLFRDLSNDAGSSHRWIDPESSSG